MAVEDFDPIIGWKFRKEINDKKKSFIKSLNDPVVVDLLLFQLENGMLDSTITTLIKSNMNREAKIEDSTKDPD